MQRRYSLGLTTMVMLVLMRLAIGWHFYSEGSKHYIDPNWSSKGFLRSATGPLAPYYQGVLPDDFAWNATFHADSAEPPSIENWGKRVTDSWQDLRKKISDYYKLTAPQQEELQQIFQRRKALFVDWLDSATPGIENHIHEWRRLSKARGTPSSDDVPFERKRIAEKQAVLDGEAGGWLGRVRAIERDLQADVDRLLTPEQRKLGSVPADSSQLETVDKFMTYLILGVGVCLLLGLFTRLASLAGAAFLMSVVLSQPLWARDAQPTYNQLVEMLALLTLATTTVGRWGGLDFFLHYLFVRPFCCSAKGNSDGTKS